MNKIGFFGIMLLVLSACNNNDPDIPEIPPAKSAPPTISYNIINSYPHDPESFTQGLTFYEGQLYESTGSPADIPNNGSWAGTIDMNSGKIQKKVSLPNTYFGEGITILNNKLYQLTWQNKKGFVYDIKTWAKIREFNYTTEGWGLTNNGKILILSDGSSTLHFLDPETLETSKKLKVTDNNGPVSNLNELEFIDGFIYANKYLTNYILKIDPETGEVTGKIDLTALVKQVGLSNPEADVLNGIAYNDQNGKMYITGKKWPNLFEITFQ